MGRVPWLVLPFPPSAGGATDRAACRLVLSAGLLVSGAWHPLVELLHERHLTWVLLPELQAPALNTPSGSLLLLLVARGWVPGCGGLDSGMGRMLRG